MKKPVRACEDMDLLLLYIDFTDLEEGKLEKAFGNKKQDLVDMYAAYCDSKGRRSRRRPRRSGSSSSS